MLLIAALLAARHVGNRHHAVIAGDSGSDDGSDSGSDYSDDDGSSDSGSGSEAEEDRTAGRLTQASLIDDIAGMAWLMVFCRASPAVSVQYHCKPTWWHIVIFSSSHVLSQSRQGISSCRDPPTMLATRNLRFTPADEDFGDWAATSGIEGPLLAELQQRGADASCKTLFTLQLLDQLVAEGHRTLIFSQSRVMLDILQARGGLHCLCSCSFFGITQSLQVNDTQDDTA